MIHVGRPRKNNSHPPGRGLLFDLLKKMTHHERKLRGYAETLARHSCTRELLVAKADTLDLVRDWVGILLQGQNLEGNEEAEDDGEL